MADRNSIHTRIKQLRKAAGMSMVELAKAVGVSSWQAVQQWENGSTAPSRARVEKLAQVLGTTPEILVFGKAGSPGAESDPAIARLLDDLAALPKNEREIWLAEIHLAALKAKRAEAPPGIVKHPKPPRSA